MSWRLERTIVGMNHCWNEPFECPAAASIPLSQSFSIIQSSILYFLSSGPECTITCNLDICTKSLPTRQVTVTPVTRLYLLTKKVSIFRTPSEFEFWGSCSSNVKVNPVFSWKGQNSFQRIFPAYSQHFTTPQISFEFSGVYYTSNSFLIKPINTNDQKTCPFREIFSQQIGRGEDRME